MQRTHPTHPQKSTSNAPYQPRPYSARPNISLPRRPYWRLLTFDLNSDWLGQINLQNFLTQYPSFRKGNVYLHFIKKRISVSGFRKSEKTYPILFDPTVKLINVLDQILFHKKVQQSSHYLLLKTENY
jgi:hypothetical protein